MQNRAVQCTIVPPFHYLASPGSGEARRADRPAVGDSKHYRLDSTI